MGREGERRWLHFLFQSNFLFSWHLMLILKGGCTRFEVEHNVVYRKNKLNIGEIFVENFTALKVPWNSSLYSDISANVRTSEYRLLIIGYFADYNIFFWKIPNFYYVFPIYNSKLHDICSTSNLVHPPLKVELSIIRAMIKSMQC